jgi:hypothetical protein
MTAPQREASVAIGGATHGKRHQVDVRLGHRRGSERQFFNIEPLQEAATVRLWCADCSPLRELEMLTLIICRGRHKA